MASDAPSLAMLCGSIMGCRLRVQARLSTIYIYINAAVQLSRGSTQSCCTFVFNTTLLSQCSLSIAVCIKTRSPVISRRGIWVFGKVERGKCGSFTVFFIDVILDLQEKGQTLVLIITREKCQKLFRVTIFEPSLPSAINTTASVREQRGSRCWDHVCSHQQLQRRIFR